MQRLQRLGWEGLIVVRRLRVGGQGVIVLWYCLLCPIFFLWVGVISFQLCGCGGDACPIGGILF